MPFNLAAFESAYWAEVAHLALLRGHKTVSPFSRQVARVARKAAAERASARQLKKTAEADA